MPRTARQINPEGGIYHITARGINRMQLFHEADDYRFYLSMLASIKKDLPAWLHHYTLMPNHIHLCLAVGGGTVLAEAMKRLQHAYADYFKKRHQWSGHVWQGRFFSKPIQDDGYLYASGIYIEKNPVRAGIVKSPEEYEWSSFRHYALGEPNGLIDDSPLYIPLGQSTMERQNNYRRLAAQ